MLAERVDELRAALDAVADPDRAPAMAAYMRHRFRFLGVAAPARKRAQRSFIAFGRDARPAELLDAAHVCWAQPEREFQYVGADLLRRWVDQLGAADLDRLETLIRTRPWWDTVDALAAHVVGAMVRADPELVAAMDRWIDDDDIWIARTAILHQLTFRERTDAARLFDYVDRRCADQEFFLRKASGWALREYAKVDADAVR
ncbi:MAG: DNA alkylation repair protein, partial [Ilumatobacter sp.]|nr:DNA alkylation repair protein [Ilumatobacter sp.]